MYWLLPPSLVSSRKLTGVFVTYEQGKRRCLQILRLPPTRQTIPSNVWGPLPPVRHP
ncbi:uncharacterized protein LACBIDRAFT_310313 [Laccaria bicolor S238N-H82]|uniref:Predicted protein n=1 Tax=Laccaria bicolor (strain S238N-H82 / ATCC MYA-4686) TaxID=486041 RepID=B0DU35_LACBS|nr:uncharacterized protein LACBIDRAFT_310313 [Laccaria bicolor S238N-H82]EDR01835.1 predicted protein [Laccaria bicolor S238N-H82]|eukprot:XP_001887445.1 predicted protein [Laccaria bicolor S238N-H82]